MTDKAKIFERTIYQNGSTSNITYSSDGSTTQIDESADKKLHTVYFKSGDGGTNVTVKVEILSDTNYRTTTTTCENNACTTTTVE